ncbi:MAG: ABC transporter permease, partial [Clostridiales bacterium]|nr:ABC transporter permease [Clostridiales bacterium]
THPYTKRDYALVSLSFVGTGIPSFFLALVLIWLFTIQLGWLPSSGMTTLGTGGGALDVLRHMVMPVTVLTVYYTGVNLRYFRSSMLEISQQDYLRTARAKGIGERRVVWNHGLRNTLLTVITVVGTEVPMLFGGSIIVEQVFSWPGLGLMTMSAITSRDYPVIMGVCLMTAVVVVLVNLVTDILYALADPTVELK